jgi:hypothetical protein
MPWWRVRSRLLIALLTTSFGWGGCATTPVAPSAATQVPSDRLLAFQEKTDATNATLVITRDHGFVGSACYLSVAIDGTLAARLAVEETARFYVKPGEVLLRVGRDPEGQGLCAFGQGDWTQRETIVRQGETKYFRLSIDANGKKDIQRSE